MRAIEHSVEEEPLIKKAKLIDKVENCHEVSMLPLNETVVKGNEEVCLLDMEDKKETCVEVESNERKKEEVSVSSLVDRKHVVSGDENVEKKEEGSVISAVTSSDEVPVVKNNDSCVVSGDETVEKNEEGCVILAVTSSDEVPVVKNNDSCVVSGEETIEKNKEGSVISAVTSNDEVPVVKNNESCVVSGDETIEKNEEGSVISAVMSSDEVSVVENNDSCVVFGGISGVNSLVLRKKLLVLDLNGLLADIVTPLKDVPADINIGRRAIFKRPFCDEFLRFCFDKFEVGIWSSRKQNNVVRITEFLLGDLKSKLLFCWVRWFLPCTLPFLKLVNIDFFRGFTFCRTCLIVLQPVLVRLKIGTNMWCSRI
ncbi:FCP1 homology domain [Arabidopsis thaliana x Arabidopsis arenosa]|uniref:Mitochondrial import inner membrane translocase subunit TIM50 n=2 Tax=Arabidopsis TaxID=3701 RepID=A0A8T2EUC2_9BRAS|nr:FCP1 homology domain [Arabidopsis thaliana x Arabidopsis arenosa]